MADTSSTTSFRADISQLRSAMQQAQKQVALANSEFKKATAGLDNWSKSATGLQAKLKQLDSVLSAQKSKLELLKEEYEKTTKEYGKNSSAALRVKTAMNNQEAAIKKTEKEIEDYNQELKKAEQYGDNFEESINEMNSATQSASDGFTVMKGALANLVADGIRLAIDAIKELAKQTIETGMNFEQSMAQVEAISGATGEELEALTEKAKEMGAKTKFSATESAEAFNYMAMAGWKTEDMINGIEGIMNLAAASGSDLATTSDIVTDALTAMGYSAGDAGRLADVMAAASSNANTNVELMGQTFQYAAPLVGALGYSMEDTAVQIGLMANAGIKGTKAGTALRSMLSRLSAPPKECAEAMEDLGISLTDSDGKMKSLDAVMADLRSAFANMGEAEQTATAKAIAGQEAMSGLLAIVNAAPADYEKLTKAVRESEGAASSMADTMNDTVEGQLTLLKSQIEGIEIQIYEKLKPALRDGIDSISKTLANVNWDKVAETFGNLTKKAVEFAIKVVDNFEGIVSVLKSVGTVLAATFVVSKILSFAQTISGLVNTFRAIKAATDAATTSQLLLNAAQAATPVGLVAAAVAGLAAGVLYLASKTDEATTSTQILTQYEEEQIAKINELNAAYNEMQMARTEAVAGIQSEFDHYSDLAAELDTLVDANGQVKAGYEDRVNFILSTLNEACGTEMQLVDGVIENYKEEKKVLDNLLQTKKAEAILRANEELYTTAVQKQDEALQNLISAQGMYKQNTSEMAAVEKKYNAVMQMTAEEYVEQNDLTYDLGTAANQLKNEQEELGQKFLEAKAAVGESRVAMSNAQSTYDEYMSTIQNYEGLSSAIISGDADKIQTALLNMQNDFMTAETATRGSLERQLQNYKSNLAALESAIQNGTPNVTQEMVNQARSMVTAAQAELDKAPADFSAKANSTAAQYASSIGSGENQEAARQGAKTVLDAAAEGLQDEDGQAEESGQNLSLGYINGVEMEIPNVNEAAQNVSESAVESLNAGQRSRSPSQATTESGENFGQGYINGMNNKNSAVYNAAYNLARTAWNALKAGQKEGSPSKLTYQSGVYFVQGYMNGIASQNKQLQRTAQNMVVTVVKELAKLSNFNFEAVASNAATKFSDALSKKIEYSISRMQYENEGRIAVFDNAIDKYEKQKENSGNKIQKASDKRIAKYEKEESKAIKALEKQRDADIKELEKYRDSTIKTLEKSRDTQIKSIESNTAANVKALEKQRDSQIKTIERTRDVKIKTLEGERDSRLESLQKELDNLGYKREDSARRRQLQKEIKSIKDSANKKIQAAKNSATKDIKATKDGTTKAIKAENKEANKEIKAVKSATNEKIKAQKSGSNAQIKAVKSNANKEIKAKQNETKKAVEAEKASAKKQIDASDAKYNKLIANENKKKEAYQRASSEMITAYQNAMQEYQSKAEGLINDTINGITDTYGARYDELIGKQNDLIDKLKSAGELFDISGAGVMTVNDLKAQTKQITEYASKLQTIKAKVSTELFDEIAKFDMKEGSAYIDRLLAMSAKDLNEYNKAYSEKMKAAEKAGENIYNADIQKVANDYQNEINKAFKNLPKQLEELGMQTMKGFVSGLTSDTDYMSKEIKIYINSMLNTFKKQLGIQSPSKVMMKIGDYTGEGLVNGLKSTISEIKKTALNMAQAASTPLDNLGAVSSIRASYGSAAGGVIAGNTTVNNNYNLVQNNTSPKSLSALETYTARREQIAMIKAYTTG